MNKFYNQNMPSQKYLFFNQLKGLILKEQKKCLDIVIKIGKNRKNDIKIQELNFDFDFKEEIADKVELSQHKIHLYFEDVVFNGKVTFKNVAISTLGFKDVTFKENVRIKEIKLDKLILRAYRIDAHVVINIGKYASNNAIVNCDNCYIDNIEFEDPHICNAKIYFIGIAENTYADFTNRNLENVIFQNCNFAKTYFLNSFLKGSKFLSCQFPLIENEYDMAYMGYKQKIFIGVIIFTFVFFIYDIYVFQDKFKMLHNNIKYIVYILVLPLFFIPFAFQLYRFFDKVVSIAPLFNTTLVGRHFGIKDECNVKCTLKKKYPDLTDMKEYHEAYTATISNIENIYTDLKINFKNNGDEQKAGDFYYSSSLSKIVIASRFPDALSLMGSYIVNGFGERPLRSFYIIIALLVLVGMVQVPNKDYISTAFTPSFLLEVSGNNSTDCEEPCTEYDLSKFRKHITTINNQEVNNYGFDNRFMYDEKPLYIPKLNENNIVKIYYATSHIVMPFTQDHKKWFQSTDKNSYLISILFSTIIWIYLIGMMKAIFNRIRR